MAKKEKPKKPSNTRRKYLTDRLKRLRERTFLVEQQLFNYTKEFFRICIFGSARIKPEHEVYKTTERLAYLLGLEGMDVLTGGGPGLMEAANKGLQEGQQEAHSKSKSFGLSIQVRHEQRTNEHLDIKHHHRRFSSRLDDFMRLSNVVVAMPGGIGTVLELYFAWQLMQVGHLSERPIILLGQSFWEGMVEWCEEQQISRNLVSAGDMRWIRIVDSPEEAMQIIHTEHAKFSDIARARGE